MKSTQIRCDKDNRLLMTVINRAGGSKLEIPPGGANVEPQEVPGHPELRAMWAICPDCGAKKFIGTFPK